MYNPYPDIPQTNVPDINNDYGTFRNDGTPGDHTGTPLKAEWINDMYGALLSVVKEADITPSGTPDNTTTSQFLQALKLIIDNSFGRTGTLRWEADPSSLDGWIRLDDTTVGKSGSNAEHEGTEFQDLFNLIWNQSSNADCPIFDSTGTPVARGVDADTDWNADRQLSLPKQIGRTIAAVGLPTLPLSVFSTSSSSLSFTADDTTDLLTVSSTSILNTGTKVQFETTGALPSPLATLTDYWIIQVDSTTVQVAASYSDAQDGIFIDITDVGSGTNLVTTDEVFNASAINIFSGQRVNFSTLPSPLMAGTDYFVNKIDNSKVKFSTSRINAAMGDSISFTTSGTGVHRLEPLFDTAYDNMESTGEQSHTPITLETAAHQHTYVQVTPGGGIANGSGQTITTGNSGLTGGNTPFNVMQPTTFYYCFMKL
jgi:hypothetical protein